MEGYFTLCLVLTVTVVCAQNVTDWHGSGCKDRLDAGAVSTCFSEPYDCTEKPKCKMTMTATRDGNLFKFTLSGKLEENAMVGWVGIGFSSDRRMGDDDVILCIRDSAESITISHRWNNMRVNEAAKDLGNDLILTDSSFEDGIISCQFDRTATITGDDSQTFNLTSSWHLHFGVGPLNAGGVAVEHWHEPYSSDDMITLSEKTRVTINESLEHEKGEGDDATSTAGTLFSIVLAVLFQRLL